MSSGERESTALSTWKGPLQAIASCLSHYFDWRGRASRSEFWWFMLFYIVSYVTSLWLSAELQFPVVLFVLGLLVIPGLGAAVRRLHDTGRSGGWWFLSWVPLIGLVLLVFYCEPSEPGINRYGPPPVA
jgi:uncharacterized membrane protein YhaH (DUF805 family)